MRSRLRRGRPGRPTRAGEGGDQSRQELAQAAPAGASARPLPAPRAASRSLRSLRSLPQPPSSGSALGPPLGSERLPAELLLRRSQRAPPASALQAVGSRGSHLLGKTPASRGPSPASHPAKDRALWGVPGSLSVPALSFGRAASTPGLGAGQTAWCPVPSRLGRLRHEASWGLN